MWQNTCYNNELKLMKKSCRPKSELTVSYVLNKGFFCFVLLKSLLGFRLVVQDASAQSISLVMTR